MVSECDSGRADCLQGLGHDLGADPVTADDPDPMGHEMSLHEKTAHTGVDGGANAGRAPAYGMTITEKRIDMRPSGYPECDPLGKHNRGVATRDSGAAALGGGESDNEASRSRDPGQRRSRSRRWRIRQRSIEESRLRDSGAAALGGGESDKSYREAADGGFEATLPPHDGVSSLAAGI